MAESPTENDLADVDRLVLFHKIMAGLCLVGSCCGLPHLTIGIMAWSGRLETASKQAKTNSDASFMGPVFTIAGAAIIVFVLTISLLNFLAAKRIANRRALNFIYVVSALNLLLQPIGMALGIYSFVTLSRASIKQMFDAR